MNALLDEMRCEITRPVRRRTVRSTPRTKAQRSLEMAQLHSKRDECWERVDDEGTAIPRVSVPSLGICGHCVAHVNQIRCLTRSSVP